MGNLRPFQPGQSGNPGGRPKGIASAVKGKVSADELADIFLSVALDSRAKPMERIAAARELADRGWGKAPAFAAIEGHDPLELDATLEALQGLTDELRARRDAREAPTGSASLPDAASG